MSALEPTLVRPTVLVVDDDPSIRRLAVSLLRQWFTVLEASNGEEALTVLERLAWPPGSKLPTGVVLLDIMMPGLDGITVCRRIKNEFPFPVIMFTARANASDVRAAFASGADDYLVKPFSLKTLVEKVAKHARVAISM